VAPSGTSKVTVRPSATGGCLHRLYDEFANATPTTRTDSSARTTTRATRRRWRSCSGSESLRYEGRGSSVEDAIGGAGYPGLRSIFGAVRVEPGLQDHLRGRRVDHAAPARPGDPRGPERALGFDGGEPFVVQRDRHGEHRAEGIREVGGVGR